VYTLDFLNFIVGQLEVTVTTLAYTFAVRPVPTFWTNFASHLILLSGSW
jgi:hypothetical protein